MATWLAADQLDFCGAWSVASGWLRRAHRLLEPLEAGPEHGWIAFHEGFLAHAARDTAAAIELAARAAVLGRRHGVADLEMLGLALQGRDARRRPRVSRPPSSGSSPATRRRRPASPPGTATSTCSSSAALRRARVA